MTIRKTMPLVIAATLMAGACTDVYEPKPHMTEVDGRTVISSTASLSHIVAYNAQSETHTCTHPAPDAAFNQGQSSDLSFTLISLGGGDDEGAEGESSEETEMAGRSPAVLITRELFYRLCEFSKNQGLSKDEAKDLYLQTLSTVKDVWAVEAGQTTVSIGDTLTTTDGETITSVPNAQISAGSSASAVTTTTLSKSDATTESECTAANGSWDSTYETCS